MSKKNLKVVAFNGSPKSEGNTSILIKKVFEVLEKEGIETESVQVGGKKIHGCTACFKCYTNRNSRCSVNNDILNDCVEKMIQADGIILASPTYFANVTSEIKALIDRAGLVGGANNYIFKRKVGAAVIVERRGGATNAFDSINKLFLENQMIVPGSSYWNFACGLAPGDVEKDEEGLNTMRVLGENMAWLLKKLN
jgi:multimeric flavodoxin WrbA